MGSRATPAKNQIPIFLPPAYSVYFQKTDLQVLSAWRPSDPCVMVCVHSLRWTRTKGPSHTAERSSPAAGDRGRRHTAAQSRMRKPVLKRRFSARCRRGSRPASFSVTGASRQVLQASLAVAVGWEPLAPTGQRPRTGRHGAHRKAAALAPRTAKHEPAPGGSSPTQNWRRGPWAARSSLKREGSRGNGAHAAPPGRAHACTRVAPDTMRHAKCGRPRGGRREARGPRPPGEGPRPRRARGMRSRHPASAQLLLPACEDDDRHLLAPFSYCPSSRRSPALSKPP